MERGSGSGSGVYAGEAPRPTEFYHGTSLEAILAIQATGFRVDLAGTNAGAALGAGVYVTTTLEKALNYAKGVASSPNPADGGVFQLRVDLGRCYTVRSGDRGERKGWAERGYDSAWAAAGIIGAREENCVRDPARVGIVNVVLGNTAAAGRLGYEVRNGRLEPIPPEDVRGAFPEVIVCASGFSPPPDLRVITAPHARARRSCCVHPHWQTAELGAAAQGQDRARAALQGHGRARRADDHAAGGHRPVAAAREHVRRRAGASAGRRGCGSSAAAAAAAAARKGGGE